MILIKRKFTFVFLRHVTRQASLSLSSFQFFDSVWHWILIVVADVLTLTWHDAAAIHQVFLCAPCIHLNAERVLFDSA